MTYEKTITLNTLPDVAKELRSIATEQNLSAFDLSRRMKVTQKTAWHRINRANTWETIELVAQALGYDLKLMLVRSNER